MIVHLSDITSAAIDDSNGTLTFRRRYPPPSRESPMFTLTRRERIRLREFLDILDAKTE